MKTILITGGASGLGRAILLKLVLITDYKVFFTYFNSKYAALELMDKFPNCIGVKCDFSNKEAVNNLLETIPEYDILINNAIPSFEQKHFHKFELEEYELGFTNNILPVIKLLTHSVKSFKKKKSGKILNILSSSVFGPPPLGYSRYTAEKKYIESLSNSIALEYGKFNIQVNCISPSFMETKLNSYLDDRFLDEMRKSTPLKEFLQPEEVAEIIEFFCKTENAFLNGQNINLNAGK